MLLGNYKGDFMLFPIIVYRAFKITNFVIEAIDGLIQDHMDQHQGFSLSWLLKITVSSYLSSLLFI